MGESEQHCSAVAAYRRIGKAAQRGVGVRLSSQEVHAIWNYDFAIRGAVEAADYGDTHDAVPST